VVAPEPCHTRVGMAERETTAMWRSRLRWRLRGAWQWPTFVAATVADAVLLARLPFAGGRSNLLGSFLAAGFLNLIAVAVLGRAGGSALRRRQPAQPSGVAADRAATAGMVALTALLLAGGVAHRGAVTAEDRAQDLAIGAARRYAVERAPAQYVRNLHRSDTWQPGPDVFRTCFPGADPRRDWCVIVRTDEPVPVIRRDPDQRPNNTIAGTDNPGRSGG
jgi:hypothetical protein